MSLSNLFKTKKKFDENFILEKIYINLKLSPGYEAHFLIECKMVSVYFLSFSCFKKILWNKKASFRVNLQMIKIKSQKMCLCIWSALVSCKSWSARDHLGQNLRCDIQPKVTFFIFFLFYFEDSVFLRVYLSLAQRILIWGKIQTVSCFAPQVLFQL